MLPTIERCSLGPKIVDTQISLARILYVGKDAGTNRRLLGEEKDDILAGQISDMVRAILGGFTLSQTEINEFPLAYCVVNILQIN